MTLFAGLDINAGRLRAVSGLAASRPLALDTGSDGAMRLAISLEGRRPEVGSAGLQLCRRLPHLACVNFLPQLGAERRWIAGRHRLDAGQALALVLKKVQPALTDVTGLACTLPVYLGKAQTTVLTDLAKQARLPLLGWVAAPLAAAWTASVQQPWSGPALVLDVDEHALTWTAVTVDDTSLVPQARMLAVQTAPGLSLTAWKEHLLDGIADRCIRQSRRDLRASGDVEQLLWEQLDGAMETCRRGQLVELVVRSERWYQDLVLRPGEFEQYCADLVQRCVTDLRDLLTAARFARPPAMVLATATAACLPGLLRTLVDQTAPHTPVVVLPADALAQAAQELAVRWHDGSLPRGPIDTVIGLKKMTKAKLAAARPEVADRHTKLPARGGKRLRSADDDFSVTIDE